MFLLTYKHKNIDFIDLKNLDSINDIFGDFILKQIFNKQKHTQFLNETCYTRLLPSQNKSSLWA